MKYPFPPYCHRSISTALVGLLTFIASFGGSAIAAPQSFTEIKPAIAAAKEGKQLLLFVLLKGLSEESEAVEKILAEDLVLSDKEFVVVRCKVNQSAHRGIFTEKFKLDPEKAPIAAVTDAEGGVLVSVSGTNPASYRAMIQVARAKSGLETNTDKNRKAIEKMGQDDSIVDGAIGKKIAAMGQDPLFLVKERTWTLKSGKTMKASLLEAKGATGVFVDDAGKEVELPFNSLSAEDIALLQKTLK